MTHLQGMPEEEDDDLFTQIERRLRYTVKEANKRYWVGDNFNGYDEFKCTEELSFNEFRDKCVKIYDEHHWAQSQGFFAQDWNYDTNLLGRDYVRKILLNSVDGINKHRRQLGKYIDERMTQIITREADATKDSRNPRTYLDFVTTRIPSVGFIVSHYRITGNQAAEQIRDKKLGSKYTTEEWYNKYKDLHRQAYLSEQRIEELSLPEHSRRPGYNKPDSTKGASSYGDRRPINSDKKQKKTKVPKPVAPTNNKRVYENDIAYPFKSKIKRYRKDHPDEEVLFIETPTQTRIDYKHIQRPYFSNTRGAWEIDHCFNMVRPGDKWMFCININTRYLVAYEIPERADHVLSSLQDLHKRHLVTSIRGDGSVAYCPQSMQNAVLTPEILKKLLNASKYKSHSEINLSYEILDWAMQNGITLYFNSGKFTLHNKIIDVAIKTIRNAIGYRILKPGQLQQIIDYYNNTMHKTIGCTPTQMHNNPDIEYQYIRWCERKLSNVIDTQREQKLLEYQKGNILMVHIDTGKTAEKMEKRRSFYDRIGEFIAYVHGNVKVKLDVPIRISSSSAPVDTVVIPIYYTKFVAKNRSEIPENVNDYYVTQAYQGDSS